MAKARFVLFAWVLAMVMVAQPVVAAALTSVVEDPVGDVGSSTGNAVAPPYRDIAQASISTRDGRFIFMVDMAAPIPASPAMPPGIVLLAWLWGLDTNPATAPAGFPFAPGTAAPPEFIVLVLWDGTGFTGILIDRRPLLRGGDAVITFVLFDIKGTGVAVLMGAGLLDNPSSFTWVSRTSDWATPLGANSNFELDRAPDTGRALWPS